MIYFMVTNSPGGFMLPDVDVFEDVSELDGVVFDILMSQACHDDISGFLIEVNDFLSDCTSGDSVGFELDGGDSLLIHAYDPEEEKTRTPKDG